MAVDPTAAPAVGARLTLKLMGICLAAVIGSSVPFGYNMAVTNVPTKVIQCWIRDAHYPGSNEPCDSAAVVQKFALINSLIPIGGIFGAIFSGMSANKLGTRVALIMSNIFALLGCLFCSSAKAAGTVWLLVVGRFFCGVHIGLASSLGPTYLAEMSPPELRGTTAAINNFTGVLAILIAQILGLPDLLGGVDVWPFLFLFLPLVFMIAQVIGLLFCPDPPELPSDEPQPAELTWSQLLRRPHRRFVAICVVLMIFQQLSGINAVMMYSTNIFTDAKLTEQTAQLATLGIGGINLVATVTQGFLIDRLGRRPLLIGSFIGMLMTTQILIVCLTAPGAAAGGIAALLAYVVAFALGAGGIPWLYPNEVFEGSARPKVSGLVATVSWLLTTVVLFAFPPVKEALGNLAFCPFAGCIWLAIAFLILWVAETKGKSPADMYAENG